MVHHDPTHADRKLEEMQAQAAEIAGRYVELGHEGLSISL